MSEFYDKEPGSQAGPAAGGSVETGVAPGGGDGSAGDGGISHGGSSPAAGVPGPPEWDAIYKLTPEQAARIRANPPPRDPPMTEERQREAIEREYAVQHALRGEKLQAYRWDPFPVEALPEPCRTFVTEAAASIGCDESYIALPLLSALAAVVGNARSIRLEADWDEPAVVWSAIVGEGGTLKSPALDMALQPLWRQEVENIRKYEQALELFPQQWRAYWEVRNQGGKGRAGKGAEGKGGNRQENGRAGTPAADEAPGCFPDRFEGEPVMPVRPVCRRTLISKVTMEAVEEILAGNPRGVLLARDELAGWLASFDGRRGGKGSEAADWLTIFNARALLSDRGRGARKILHIPRAAVSVTGGIQPAVLRAALARGQAQEGFGARLLLAWPPRRDRVWKLQPLSPSRREELIGLFRQLRDLEPDCDAEGKPAPRPLPLVGAAKMEWFVFYRNWGFHQAGVSGEAAATYAKMECYAARLALIVHLVRTVSGTATPEGVDGESMAAGIKMAEWFAWEARRIMSLFAGSPNPDDPGRLVDWIWNKGGRVSIFDLMRGPRAYRKPGAAEEALDALSREGYGTWVSEKTGGRPKFEFVLNRWFDEEGGDES